MKITSTIEQRRIFLQSIIRAHKAVNVNSLSSDEWEAYKDERRELERRLKLVSK